MKRTVLAGTALMLAIGAPEASWASRCSDLMGEAFGDAAVRMAQEISTKDTPTLNGEKLNGVPDFCRVVLNTGVKRHSNIVVEVWLPIPDAWNHKLLGTGNGRFAGAIRYNALIDGVKRGYAVMNTDQGTFPAATIGGAGYAAGTGRPDVLKDWGYRSTHEMTVAGAAVTRAYYEEKPRRTYFAGCSTGGHQALMEAQRYPDDYDGIIAGDAGHNRTHLHLAFLQTYQLVHKTQASYIPADKVKIIHEAVLSACVGKDGGAPDDAYLNDPTACKFEPKTLLCKPDQSDGKCLSSDQVQALENIYGGFRNSRTGHVFYPPWVKGSEESASRFFGKATGGYADPAVSLVPWVFGPKFDVLKFDFDRDLDRVDRDLGPIVNALDSDLSAFARRGGKLIMFHGWADAVVSPLDSINYFERLRAKGQDRSNFARLFMAPGMDHCRGGPGAASFGQGPDVPAGIDEEHDLLKALGAWVEHGRAPEQIITTKFDPQGKALFERPLCAYPAKSEFAGGDEKEAKNFQCPQKPLANYPAPAPEYLR